MHIIYRSPRAVPIVLAALLLLCGAALPALAQTPQYTNGLTGTTSNSYPFNTTSYRKTEHHYLPGEFSGAYAGNIMKVYVKRSTTTTSSVTYSNLTIWLAQTTSTSFPSNTTFWTAGTTQVFNQSSYTIPAGSAGTWVGFTLPVPYYYDPGKSLIVILCHDGYSGTGFSLYCQSFSVPPYRRIYGSTTCASTSGTSNDGYNYHFGFDLQPAYSLDAGISGLSSPVGFCPGTENVVVKLKNFGTTTLTSATVNWTWDGVAQTPISWSGSLAFGSEDLVTLGSKSFAAGTTHNLEAWSSSPNGSSDPNPANDSLKTSLTPAVSGNFTIGGGSPDYATFTDAVNALKNAGVCGPVTFNVAAGTYTEQVTIPAIVGASATNTITFDGGAGNAASRVLTYNGGTTSNTFTLRLSGADWLRFRNLTIEAAGTYGYAVHLTGQADNNEITNCVVKAYANATSSYSIALLASGADYSTYDNSANNTLIQNNTISGGYYCVMFRGISSSYPTNNQILDNTIKDWYYYGSYFYYQSGLHFERNAVTQRTTGSYTTSGYGIYSYYNNYAPVFRGNKIRSQAYGMYMYYTNQANISRGLIANNTVIDMAGSTSSTNYGIYLPSSYSMDIWHNSISMNTQTGTGYGLYVSSGSGHDIRNNAVAYFGTSGTGYLLYISSASYVTTLDFNNYYSTSTATNKYYFNGSYYPDLASLQAAYPSYNAGSVSGNTYYYDNKADLHSNSHAGYKAGTPIAAITDDMDGESRDPVNPCIGADEYPQPPPEKDIEVEEARIGYASGRWAHIEGFDHPIVALLENTGLETVPSAVTLVYKEGSPPADPSDGVAETFTPAWVGKKATCTFSTPWNPPSQGIYTIYIAAFYPGDGDPTNDLGSDMHNVQGVKTYGFEDFFSIDPPDFHHNWLVNNAGGAAAWNTTGGFGVGGTNAATYPGDVSAADDWVFTPGALLDANTSYRVRFKYRSRTGSAQTLQVYWGMAQTPADMLSDPLRNFYSVTFSNTAYADAFLPSIGIAPYFNTPNIIGNYYIGFRVTSGGGAGEVDIDNIILDLNPVPPPKLAYGPPGTPVGGHIDTQNSSINLTATYKQISNIVREYEVVSSTNIYGTPGDFLWWGTSNQPWLQIAMDPAEPTQYLPSNPYTPERPRQWQKFTLTAKPYNLPVGSHQAIVQLTGRLFNDTYVNGIDATNQPLRILVNLRVSTAGGGMGNPSATHVNMTPGGSPYIFADANGDIFARVFVNAGVIPHMTITAYPGQFPGGMSRLHYVKRYFTVDADGRDWLADIDWFYTESEALAGGVNTPLRLKGLMGVRQPYLGGAWEIPIDRTTSTPYPADYFVHVTDFGPEPQPNFGGRIGLACPWLPKQMADQPEANTFQLDQNYPNPFNPSTLIRYALAENTRATLTVYDVFWRQVRVLVDEEQAAGAHTATFDASNLPSGTYYYKLQAGSFVQLRKMSLTK